MVSAVHAQTPAPALPDPVSTSVQAMGWMQGFPPAADKLITFDNPVGNTFPRNRWTFSHIREITPTANVWRGPGSPSALRSAPVDIEHVRFKVMGTGEELSFAQALDRNYTDGILVMHKGRVIYEKYLGALEPQRPHLAMSVTKSFVGTLAALLAHEGLIKPEAPVTDYLPEMKNTAYGDATVRQVMDMTIGVKYSENYADPKAEVWDYARAGGMMPQGQGLCRAQELYEFRRPCKKRASMTRICLQDSQRRGPGLDRAPRQRQASGPVAVRAHLEPHRCGAGRLLHGGSHRHGIGRRRAQHHAARPGPLRRADAQRRPRRQRPAGAAQGRGSGHRRGADPAKFVKAGYATLPGWSYRNMWWVSHNPNGAYMARGIHGQAIYIDPKAQMVVVLRLPPDCRQRRHRPDQPAHVPGSGRCTDHPLGTRQLSRDRLRDGACLHCSDLCTASLAWLIAN
jgi:CubicO group peptidase (beta-lactamase class C family)